MTKKTTVVPEEIAKFAKNADAWWDLNGPFKTLHDINPIRLRFIQSYCDLQGARVLDVGCGGGILSEGLAKAGAAVTGLDVEPASLHCAEKHAQENQLPIEYICKPIEQFDAALFDHITCMELLEHVENPQKMIAEAIRLLKPEGCLFLSTINRTLRAYAEVIIAAEYVLGLLPRQTHDYAKFIKPDELSYMARTNGLRLLGMSGLAYQPWSRQASLTHSVSCNYLMVFQKPSAS